MQVNHPRRPYERQACCRSSHSRVLASVGPWTPLFRLLTTSTLRTDYWLYGSTASGGGGGGSSGGGGGLGLGLGLGSGSGRCYSKVMFGASMALNFYVQAHDEADASARRQKMQEFFSWLFGKLRLDSPREAPDASPGKLRCSFISSHKGIQNDTCSVRLFVA